VQIALVPGSLSEGSTNSKALEVVALRARSVGATTALVEGLVAIPPFVPAQVDEPPTVVESFRTQLAAADAVVIAAPEYAAGLAGSVKNALDWLVGAATLYQKTVAAMSSGTTGGAYAIEQMTRTLSWQGAYVVATLGIRAPRGRMTAEGSYDRPTVAQIEAFTDRLIDACRGTPATRRKLVTDVVSAYAIDPLRFGDFR
jgi:chromate reductase